MVWICRAKGRLAAWMPQSGRVWDFITLLSMGAIQNWWIVVFWNFPFTISGPQSAPETAANQAGWGLRHGFQLSVTWLRLRWQGGRLDSEVGEQLSVPRALCWRHWPCDILEKQMPGRETPVVRLSVGHPCAQALRIMVDASFVRKLPGSSRQSDVLVMY